MAEACPDRTALEALARGIPQTPEEVERIESHLGDCTACRDALDAFCGQVIGSLNLSRLQSDSPPAVEAGVVSKIVRTLEHEGIGAGGVVGTGVGAVSEIDPLSILDPSGREGSLGRLGPYEIVELIARGGMGIVFKALEPALNRIVAVKVLAPELAASPQARERFLQEAQAAAAVIHDNVIVIHGVSTAQGLPYLVMPYIPGPTLQGRIDETGLFSAGDIVKVGLQLARGLEAAHAKGLIHRDIKPANILLEEGLDRLRISDFGLAHAVEDSALSRSGFIAGTPQYMSPEQAEGRTVDARSDLFSLGCVLYELASGEPPFPGTSLASIVAKLRDEEAQPLDLRRPDLPLDLCRAIDKLLRKSPGDRYGSAADLRETIERLAEAFEGQAAVGGGMHRRLLVAAVAFGVIAAAFIVLYALRPVPVPEGAAGVAAPVATPPFAIARTGESFSTLEVAVARCGPSERIIVGPGEFRTKALDLSGKTLEIVAAAGASPTLILEGEEATILSDSPLVLEGLTIRQEPSFASEEAGEGLRRGLRLKGARKPGPVGRPRLPPILHAERAPLRLVKCRLIRLEPLRRTMSEGSVIAAQNSPRIEIHDSEVYSLDRISIGIHSIYTKVGRNEEGGETPTPRVEMVNSLFVCGGILKVAGDASAPVEVKFDGSLCVTRCLLLIERELPEAELRFTVDRTIFDCDHILYGANVPPDEYPRRMRWTAREAVYSLRSTFIRAHNDLPPHERLPVPAILEEWQTLWGAGEQGSRSTRLRFREMFFQADSLNRAPRQASFKLEAELEAAGVGPRWPIGPGADSGATPASDETANPVAPRKLQEF